MLRSHPFPRILISNLCRYHDILRPPAFSHHCPNPHSSSPRRFLSLHSATHLSNPDILSHFFAASGLLPHDANASTVVDANDLPLDRIASARTEFPLVAVAIDDPSTIDVDDAISYSPPPTPGASCTLHIHIADVDRLLHSPSSSLFALLEQRASSAYFPGHHIPLLPPALCIMASLLPVSPLHPPHPPHQPNPCITISLSVDTTGSISNITVAPHFLPKLVRLTYDVVDRAVGTTHSSQTFREPWQRAASPLLPMPTDPRKGFVYDRQHALAFQQLQVPASPADDPLTAELRQLLAAISCVAARVRAHREKKQSDVAQQDVDVYSEFQYQQPSDALPPPSPPMPSSPSSSSAPSPSCPPLDVCGRLTSSTADHPPSPSNCTSAAASASSPPAASAASAARAAPSSLPPRLNARYTVAELMVAACAASASWCHSRSVAVHYRSQRAPNINLAQLQQHSSSAFLSAARSSLASAPHLPHDFPSAELLSAFVGKMAAISGMHAAVSDVQPLRHYGIGVDAYTQSTSPIRRFSDLLVQRQMKAALGFGEPVPADRVLASLARQNAVRASIKRTERLLERRALLGIVRGRQLAADDASQFLYHGVVLRALPPGKGSPGHFGDFAADSTLLPPSLLAHFARPISGVPAVRCGWFVMLIPALGALERVLLPLGTPPGMCIKVIALSCNAAYGRIKFLRV